MASSPSTTTSSASSSSSPSSSTVPNIQYEVSDKPQRLTRVPAWVPLAAFVGTSAALAIPLFMIYRRKGKALRVALNSNVTTPPPRRSGTVTTSQLKANLASSSASAATAKEPVFESSSEGLSPGTSELMHALSKMDKSTGLMAAKAFGIATALVVTGGVGLALGVKSLTGVQDAREFGQLMRTTLYSSLPSLSTQIRRSPESEEERLDSLRLVPLGTEDTWSWPEAEKRLKRAYDEGGFPLWAQAALREMEAELRMERKKREREVQEREARMADS
ncbi:hypothetical protein CVT24_007909 [Panaeolus cyanescens]|uniref:Uncharacterized protein n=1 Tax=Panaeolus cyanescens TaxID=181874 RepID=A0A409W0A6_9AGAR|nr:hypothetical protein CVT24_007909 [Panaeolus cyanescens]